MARRLPKQCARVCSWLLLSAACGALAAGLGLPVPEALPTAAAAAVAADPGDRKRSVDRQIDVLQDDLEETSAGLAAAYVRLRQTQARLPGARQALAAATSRVQAADQRHDQIADELAVARAAEEQAARQLAARAAAARDAVKQVGNLAADAYQSGGLTGLAVVLDPDGPSDLAERLALMETVTSLQQSTLRDLRVQQAEGRAQQAYLVAVRQQVAGLERAAAEALQEARQARADAAAAKAGLEALVAEQRREAAAIERRRAAEAARLTALQAESDRLARDLAARAEAARRAAAKKRQVSPPVRRGVLAYPVNAPISSEFGMRFHPILRYYRLHAGADFAVGCGTPVYAAASGRIVGAGWAGGYGNRLVIDHGLVGGNGLATTYSHLTRFVRTGGSVARGQLVAYSGTTGLSTGCHLHFEVRRNGAPVNPRTYL